MELTIIILLGLLILSIWAKVFYDEGYKKGIADSGSPSTKAEESTTQATDLKRSKRNGREVIQLELTKPYGEAPEPGNDRKGWEVGNWVATCIHGHPISPNISACPHGCTTDS